MRVNVLGASSQVATPLGCTGNERYNKKKKKASTPTHEYITGELVCLALDMRRARAVLVKSLLAFGGSVFILCVVYFNAIPRQEFTERPNKGNAVWGAVTHRAAPHRRLAGSILTLAAKV